MIDRKNVYAAGLLCNLSRLLRNAFESNCAVEMVQLFITLSPYKHFISFKSWLKNLFFSFSVWPFKELCFCPI